MKKKKQKCSCTVTASPIKIKKQWLIFKYLKPNLYLLDFLNKLKLHFKKISNQTIIISVNTSSLWFTVCPHKKWKFKTRTKDRASFFLRKWRQGYWQILTIKNKNLGLVCAYGLFTCFIDFIFSYMVIHLFKKHMPYIPKKQIKQRIQGEAIENETAKVKMH